MNVDEPIRCLSIEPSGRDKNEGLQWLTNEKYIYELSRCIWIETSERDKNEGLKLVFNDESRFTK